MIESRESVLQLKKVYNWQNFHQECRIMKMNDEDVLKRIWIQRKMKRVWVQLLNRFELVQSLISENSKKTL